MRPTMEKHRALDIGQKLAASQSRELRTDSEDSSGTEAQGQWKKKTCIPSEDVFPVLEKLASHIHLESLVVWKASPPSYKLGGLEGCLCSASNSPQHLSSQEGTTTCNQLDGANSPAGSQATDQQWCQKCINPILPSRSHSPAGVATHAALDDN